MSYISTAVDKNTVIVWERNEAGERIIRDYPSPLYFYYDDPAGEYKTIYDTPVSKVTYDTVAEYRAGKKKFEADRIRTWESDITPDVRVLSNKYFGVPAPKLNVTFLDIEVDYDPDIGFSSPENPYAPINAIAIYHRWLKAYIVLVVPPEPGWTEERLAEAVDVVCPEAPIPTNATVQYVICQDERELLINLLIEIEDTDVMAGWNSDFFDMPYIAQRILRVLDNEIVDLSTMTDMSNPKRPRLTYENNPNQTISRAGRFKYLKQMDFPTYGMPSFRPVPNATNGKLMGHTVDLVGRVRVDYMNLIKKFEPGERQSYKLSSVSDEVLVDEKTGESLLPKLEYSGSLASLYRENFAYFVRYNIRDTEILEGFEVKLGYVELANQLCHLSTGLFTHVQGTLKLAELALVNYCHHTLKRVVNNNTAPEIDRQIDGALVLYPQVGLHELVGSVDINSLYPSAIRSINISPEMIRGQFLGCAPDATEIAKGSDRLLTLILEDDDKTEITRTAKEWREKFTELKWAVSGYGTIFDQTENGFIPALLAEWYAMRKQYQAKKKEAYAAGDMEGTAYYDRLQYVYKIKLNSLYGALTNLHFRFFDLRMGESTTGTGRAILKHQCRTINQELGGEYDVDFPLYDTVVMAMKSGYSKTEAEQISLHGPYFQGKHQADAVVYGDTDSTYFKTYASSVEEATMIADAIADKVNDSYPEYMRRTFLCTPGYDTIIKAAREIVMDNGIFVEKKRYILHLVDLDGKKCDKMKVMGLDTKKTTLPAEVSIVLNGFIERYLKGETWDALAKDIVAYKTTLLSYDDITRIGLPKGVQNVEDYTTAFEDNFKARLPGHVAASIFYNQCLKLYNDKVSTPIKSGMKIKVFYLKQQQGKFKSIALPTDLEYVPNWFHDNIVVDKQAHIERLVDNPLGNILKAIGKKTPTKHSLMVSRAISF
jgi:DNA polymerase elongation subunit (family B)